MYSKIFLSKKDGLFYVGIFGKNNKLMFVSKGFESMYRADFQLIKMNKHFPFKVFNPRPIDYNM